MLKQRKAENSMGTGKKKALRVVFNRRSKLECHGSEITLDSGKNTQHSMVALMRQSLFSRHWQCALAVAVSNPAAPIAAPVGSPPRRNSNKLKAGVSLSVLIIKSYARFLSNTLEWTVRH
jgi:hypothetical protein